MIGRMHVLEVDDIGKSYDKHLVLGECSFSVPESALCALIGLNGTGKSTLLRIIVGLARADAGSVRVAGRPSRFGAPPVAAYVAQDKPLHASLRVTQVLEYAAALNGEFDGRYAREWLDSFGVPGDKTCGRLSGGQRTQVALAVAMARRAPLVVLDEPMADLDPVAREEVAERLREAADRGTSVLISSHVLGDLEGTCDRVVVLDQGRAALDGPIDRLLAEHRVLTGDRRAAAEWVEQAGCIYVGVTGNRNPRTVARIPGGQSADALPPVPDGLRIEPSTLEDITLAVLREAAHPQAAYV